MPGERSPGVFFSGYDRTLLSFLSLTWNVHIGKIMDGTTDTEF
jgi:hypothetical protein